MQLEIIEMQHNMALRYKRKDTPPIEYDGNVVKKVLTMFGSTYVCGVGFSAMTNIKSKNDIL